MEQKRGEGNKDFKKGKQAGVGVLNRGGWGLEPSYKLWCNGTFSRISRIISVIKAW